ncbi:MAG: complex I NDUFA9 subunit family protein [Pseudomonadota bacterium]
MAEQQAVERVAVFGGTGFLGRAIVARLVAAGTAARVVARHTEGPDGVQADIRDEAAVARALDGCNAAVNAVGLYVESGAETYQSVHEQGARTLAQQAAALGLARLVLISGIGADETSESSYVRARAKGEALVREAFPQATILRPSVIFGPEDKFLNTFAQILERAPFVPLFGRGETLLQPVYVGDMAEAALGALSDPAAPGATYELGGPQTYSYRALLELVMSASGRKRPLLSVPFIFWDLAAAAAGLLPRPPLTRAQVVLMKQDNFVAEDARTLADLGLTASAIETVLPDYPFFRPSPNSQGR